MHDLFPPPSETTAEIRAGGAYAHSVIARDEIAESKTATKPTS